MKSEEEIQKERLEKLSQELKTYEEKGKISWLEKIKLKSIAKIVKNAKINKIEKQEKKQRENIIKAIITCTDVFEIYDETTKEPVTIKLLKTKTTDELIETLEKILIEFQKVI